MKLIDKVKEMLKDKFYSDLIFAIGCLFVVCVCVDGAYLLLQHENETKIVEPSPYIYTVKIPINNIYGILYKDGTRGRVCANSYVWDGGKIKFYANDTLVIKEISSSCVDSVYIYK